MVLSKALCRVPYKLPGMSPKQRDKMSPEYRRYGPQNCWGYFWLCAWKYTLAVLREWVCCWRLKLGCWQVARQGLNSCTIYPIQFKKKKKSVRYTPWVEIGIFICSISGPWTLSGVALEPLSIRDLLDDCLYHRAYTRPHPQVFDSNSRAGYLRIVSGASGLLEHYLEDAAPKEKWVWLWMR